MRFGEAVVFLCIATGLHAAVWTIAPVSPGSSASGGSGQDSLSIVTASAAQNTMVSAWQRPPEVTPHVPVPQSAPMLQNALMPSLAPTQPTSNLPSPPKPLAKMVPPTPSPQVDTEPAAKPQPDTKVTTRPKLRPDDVATGPKATRAAQTQPKQQAVGTAKQASSGTGGQASSQSQDATHTHALRSKWGAEIHAKVQRNMRYPRGAITKGTAKLALTVASNGKLEALQLIRSSGDSKLDHAALSAVKRSGRFSKAPAGLGESAYAFSLSLTFKR